jgi:hypothetical protein
MHGYRAHTRTIHGTMSDDDQRRWEVGQRLYAQCGGCAVLFYEFAVVAKLTKRGYRVREVDHNATEWQGEPHGEQTRTVVPRWDRPIGKTIWLNLRGTTFARTGKRPDRKFFEFAEQVYTERVDRSF